MCTWDRQRQVFASGFDLHCCSRLWANAAWARWSYLLLHLTTACVLTAALMLAGGWRSLLRAMPRDQVCGELAGATAVFLFLSDYGVRELSPVLQRRLPPGTRVVSAVFPLPGTTPTAVRAVGHQTLYAYDYQALAPRLDVRPPATCSSWLATSKSFAQ